MLAFPLSRVNLVDYQILNQIAFDRNMIQKHNIELPEIEFVQQSYILGANIKVYLANHPESAKPVLVFNRKEVSFDDLRKNILTYKEERFYRWNSDWDLGLLYIDKSTPMSYVNRLKDILMASEIFRVGYAVVPLNRQFDRRYYTNAFSFFRLHSRSLQEDEDLSEFELFAIRFKNNNLTINNRTVFLENFFSEVLQKIRTYENYLFQFVVDETMSFADYIFVLNELQRAIHSVRTEYAIESHPAGYNWQFIAFIRWQIAEKIPLRLMIIDSVNECTK
jgi:hypothetical protein